MENIVKELCTYIIENLDDKISMDKIENTFYYNKYYLIRIFKLYTGYTIREFINTVKILKTIDPLIFTNDTILKIALNNGFNSQEYYSEKFRQVIGIPPLRFRSEFNNISELRDINELEIRKQYLLYLHQFYNQLLNCSINLNNLSKVKKLS